MRIFLSLLLPLFPVLILAYEPNTNLALLKRQNNGCDFAPIVTPIGEEFLHSCGTPGWGVEVDCTCCGPALACVNTIQTCDVANGVYVCLDNGYSAPSATEAPTVPGFRTTTALETSTATTGAASHTSSNSPSVSSVGTSAASKSLQRADIVGVVFVTGLLLAFSSVLK